MSLQARTKDLDRADLSAATPDFDRIPLIDIGGLFSQSLDDRMRVAREIDNACRNVGFFYVTNHGVDLAWVDAVYRVSDAFYSQPEALKLRYAVDKLGRHRGYVPIGGLAADAHDASAYDLQEGYEISLELPATDSDYLAGNIMYGPNVWPESPADFRAVVYRYFEAICGLGHALFRGFALALDMPEDFFEDKIDKPMAQLRVLYYPPHNGAIDPRHIGVGAHTDYECFTILAASAPGLQVQNSRGEWIAAPPIANAFVINIGDIMARWTNDTFKSTVHRVINTTGAKRFSLPFFFGANFHAVISCLPTCQNAEKPAKYPPVTAGQWTVSNITAAYSYRKKERSADPMQAPRL